MCDTVLALAHEQNANVVCLQEPRVGRAEGRNLTKSHPSFVKFLPLWQGVLKVLTYVAKGLERLSTV